MGSAGDVRLFGVDSFVQITRSEDRPLIVNFWSIYCPPCIAEMPVWKKLLAARADVRLVLVSTDPPHLAEKVSRVLKRHGLDDVESWVFDSDFVLPIRRSVDQKWRGTLPRTEIFLRDGQRHTVTGLVDEKTLSHLLGQDKGRR